MKEIIEENCSGITSSKDFQMWGNNEIQGKLKKEATFWCHLGSQRIKNTHS